MKLTVSGQTKEYKEGLTVAELVVLENVLQNMQQQQ